MSNILGTRLCVCAAMIGVLSLSALVVYALSVSGLVLSPVG